MEFLKEIIKPETIQAEDGDDLDITESLKNTLKLDAKHDSQPPSPAEADVEEVDSEEEEEDADDLARRQRFQELEQQLETADDEYDACALVENSIKNWPEPRTSRDYADWAALLAEKVREFKKAGLAVDQVSEAWRNLTKLMELHELAEVELIGGERTKGRVEQEIAYARQKGGSQAVHATETWNLIESDLSKDSLEVESQEEMLSSKPAAAVPGYSFAEPGSGSDSETESTPAKPSFLVSKLGFFGSKAVAPKVEPSVAVDLGESRVAPPPA